MVTKKGQKHLAYVAIVLAVIVFGANQLGYISYFPRFQTGGGTTPPPGQTVDQTMRENYLNGIGVFNVYATVTETTDPTAAAYSLTTVCNVWWMKYEYGHWIMGPSGNNVYLTLKSEDNGFAWIALPLLSAQYYYVDYQKIRANDPYIVDYQYTDVSGDGKKEFVFKYDFRNHAVPSSGYPVIQFYGYLMAQDTSFAGAGVAAYTNVTVGTATVTHYDDLYMTVSAEKTSIAIYAIEYRLYNTTDITKISLMKMQIPTLGYVDGSAFTKLITASDIRYTYTFSNGIFDGALYLSRYPNSLNKWYMQTETQCTLGSGYHATIEVILYYLTAQTEAGNTQTMITQIGSA